MKSVRVHGVRGAFFYEEAPTPRPGDGQVLVRVHASAVTPHELDWPSTWHTASGAVRATAILGHEFSGIVAAVGPEVTTVVEGDAVYGIIDAWFAEGAQAEFVVAHVDGMARKPRSVGHAETAVTPISGLTAWQALISRGQLSAGQRVLVHGAAGGVGSFAVQLARWRGAEVIATASAHNLAFARELGAHLAIDYRAQRFEDLCGTVDVILDTAGGEVLQRSTRVLRNGGTLLSVATDSKGTPYFFYVEANRAQLAELASLIDDGHVRPIVDRVLPLEQASEAYQHKPARGKTVLEVVTE